MNNHPSLKIDAIPSPLGDIKIIWGDAGLYLVEFADRGPRLAKALARLNVDASANAEASERITDTPYPEAFRRYFEDDLGALVGLPMVLTGSRFQLSVWNALRQIPAGETTTYGELATSLGHLGAARAVGSANAQNPIGIAIPCHRVIGVGGKLVGYGGGTDRKRWLLAHENAL